jgi:prepilin-type N-terminal cleavage/methylation domain-containing protein
MKCPLFRNRSAKPTSFTLVELLVVIAIIAILAGTTLTIAGNVIRSAKRAKAANTATQIQTASLAYYTEYSVYPIPSTAAASSDYLITDASGSDAAWGNLVCSLCGMINPSTGAAVTASTSIPANTRSSSDVDSVGAPLNPLPTVVSATTTNNAYFNIAMDGDYSGVLGDSSSAVNGKLPNFTLSTTTTMNYTGTSTAGIAVWANCNNSTSLTAPSAWVHTY